MFNTETRDHIMMECQTQPKCNQKFQEQTQDLQFTATLAVSKLDDISFAEDGILF